MTSLEPQNDVEAALLAAADDDSLYPEFLRALVQADVFIPQPHVEEVASGESRLEDGDEVTLPLVEHDGKTYVPVFTSLDEFRLGVPDPEMTFVRLPAAGLVEGWPEEHGMAVNPGGRMGVALDAGTVRSLGSASQDRAAAAPQRFAAGSKVLLGEPAQEPVALLDAITGACRVHGAVRAAYRALMAAEGNEDDPQIVVGFEFDEGVDAEQFFGDLGPRVASEASGAFSFIVVDETNLTSVARFMLLDTDPFFVRDRDVAPSEE